MSGINLSIFLKQKLDIHDFIVFEGEDDVGGTWKTNDYPGCGCDVNSHVYSYSYNLNPGNITQIILIILVYFLNYRLV